MDNNNLISPATANAVQLLLAMFEIDYWTDNKDNHPGAAEKKAQALDERSKLMLANNDLMQADAEDVRRTAKNLKAVTAMFELYHREVPKEEIENSQPINN